MNKTLLILALSVGVLIPSCAPASTPAELDRLIPALIQVESGGEYGAIGDGGKAVGVLQIWPIMVQDVNRIAGTRYTLADRLSPSKSVEMARIYFRHYGKNWTVEQAARCWCGGPQGYKKVETKPYWLKVKKELNRLYGNH